MRLLTASLMYLAALVLSGLAFASARAENSPPPERVETTTYGAWTVSCDEILKAKARKICSAVLRITAQNGQPLLVWLIGLDKGGKLASVIRIPAGIEVKDAKTGAVTTGLIVVKGIDLTLGTAVHHFAYSTCAPQWCEAFSQMDDSFVQDAKGAASATLTAYAASGATIKYAALSIKGIDKVFAYVRR